MFRKETNLIINENSFLEYNGRMVNKFFGPDKKHLSEQGVKMLAASMKRSLRSCLNI